MEELVFEREQIVTVLTDQPINGGLLDYVVWKPQVVLGDFVEISIGSRTCVGVIWSKGSNKIERIKLKYISCVLDIPKMSNELRDFISEMARYTINPLNKVFKLALGALDLKQLQARKRCFRAGPSKMQLKSVKRKRIFELVSNSPSKLFTMSDLTELGVSISFVNELVKLGILETSFCQDFEPYQTCNGVFSKTLSRTQKLAAEELCKLVKSNKYKTTLLKGVTGSGKTEVYLDAISQALLLGKQVLVLVPEIALSIDFVKRVINRYKVKPGEWHSGVKKSERRRLYYAISNNRVQLVIGARSALFLPFANLGLIIVDEEHDNSFKQDEGICYNARDMAVLRGSIIGGQVILASATPSLETWVNAKIGKYGRVDLNDRYGDADLPKIELLNLKDENLAKGSFISPALQKEIELKIDNGEQTLLFLNRRGYAPLTICQSCGFQLGCNFCDARLVQHLQKNRLICHQCGQSTFIPFTCPNCNESGNLKAIGPGVEKIAKECQYLFPAAKVGILSSDSVKDISQLQEKLLELASGQIDIIVGTQLVSKGHNFPKITLIGVIDADLGLQGGDLRAAEKTFQSLRQVSGRAGRYEKRGKAIIQTYSPDHPVIRAISEGKDDDFWECEADSRRKANAPPFGKMVALVLSGPNEKLLFELGRKLVRSWMTSYYKEARIFGPALAPVGKIRRKFRVRLLIKCEKSKDIQSKIREWLESVQISRSIKITVDVDPQNFF